MLSAVELLAKIKKKNAQNVPNRALNKIGEKLFASLNKLTARVKKKKNKIYRPLFPETHDYT